MAVGTAVRVFDLDSLRETTVVLAPSGTLTLVRTTPQTQDDATAMAGRLSRAGIEAVVMARR